jgi:hypothetical protein
MSASQVPVNQVQCLIDRPERSGHARRLVSKDEAACNHWTGVGLIAVEPGWMQREKVKRNRRERRTFKLTMLQTTSSGRALPEASIIGTQRRLAQSLCVARPLSLL